MRHEMILVSVLVGLIGSSCPAQTSTAEVPARPAGATQKRPTRTLNEARRTFASKLATSAYDREPVSKPPAGMFRVVEYDAPPGKLAAYLTPDPRDGKKHPAIAWITGGDCNTIGDVWKARPRNNDQSAAAYRKAGIVMMFPSLRGGNENPGQREGFLGEVDDVLAATDYLARQAYVDPKRIYLGGHSTGGTLAMLVAESSDRYRAVFSFGPAALTRGYGPEFLPFDRSSDAEHRMRSPMLWLHSVRSPLFVFEGREEPTNLASLKEMEKRSTNPLNHFYAVKRLTHFSILAPANELIVAKILRDKGTTSNLEFKAEELERLR